MAAVAADAGSRKSKKRRKAVGAVGVDNTHSAPVVVAAIDDIDRKVKKSTKGAGIDAAEDRLAAFGEAFMSSIDRPPPRSRAANMSRATGVVEQAELRKDGSVKGLAGPPGLPGEGKKRRRNKNKNKARQASKEPSSKEGASPAVPASDAAPEARAFVGSALGPAPVPEPRSRPPQMTARDRRNFMSGKVSAIRSSRKVEEGQKGSGKGRTEEDAEFQKTLKEVLHYVTPLLGKRERQQYEDSKIRALGGSIEKQHMPYKRFQETIKQNKEKRRKLVEEDKLAGVEMSANAYKASWVVDSVLKKKKEALKDKKKKQQEGLLRLGMGARERNGMATISRSAINSMNRGGSRP